MSYSPLDTEKWQDYIQFKLKYKKIDLPKEIEDMLRNLRVIYLDYDTFMSDEKGLLHVYMMDFNYKDEEFKVTKTESEEYCMDRWGKLYDKQEDCFDYILKNRFKLNLEQELWVLNTIRQFFDVIE